MLPFLRDKGLHLILSITSLLMLRERKVRKKARRTTQIEGKNIRGACLRENLGGRMACKEYVKFKTKCSKYTCTYFRFLKLSTF